MAKQKEHTNGRLEEALATLIQNQAQFLSHSLELEKYLSSLQRENTQRFARIEATLENHGRILTELVHLLERLPEAVRDKIGFKPQEQH